MKNPFKKGDTVYHPSYGEGRIYMNPKEDSDQVAVRFPSHAYSIRGYSVEKVACLSFKPWPNPQHERPFQPTIKPGTELVAFENREGGGMYCGRLLKETETELTIVGTYGFVRDLSIVANVEFSFLKADYIFYEKLKLSK